MINLDLLLLVISVVKMQLRTAVARVRSPPPSPRPVHRRAAIIERTEHTGARSRDATQLALWLTEGGRAYFLPVCVFFLLSVSLSFSVWSVGEPAGSCPLKFPAHAHVVVTLSANWKARKMTLPETVLLCAVREQHQCSDRAGI